MSDETRVIAAHIPISAELAAEWSSWRQDMIDILTGRKQPPPPPPEPDAPPAGHLTLLAATDGALRAVVELHAPQWDTWWRCGGCDSDGYDAEPPHWACRTIELIAQELGVNLEEPT